MASWRASRIYLWGPSVQKSEPKESNTSPRRYATFQYRVRIFGSLQEAAAMTESWAYPWPRLEKQHFLKQLRFHLAVYSSWQDIPYLCEHPFTACQHLPAGDNYHRQKLNRLFALLCFKQTCHITDRCFHRLRDPRRPQCLHRNKAT